MTPRRNTGFIAFGLTLAVLLFGGALGVVTANRLAHDERMVAHTHEVIGALGQLLSTLQDAETRQRGYVLIGDETYLQPYDDARRRVDADYSRVKDLTSDNADQQVRLALMKPKIAQRLGQLEQAVALTKGGNRAAAVEVIRTGTGKATMDGLREAVATMRQREELLLRQRAEASTSSSMTNIVTTLLTVSIGVGLVIVGFMSSRRNQVEQHQAARAFAEHAERLRTTLASIGDAVITTDDEARITNMNAVAESLTGWTTADAMGKLLDDVFRIVHETTRNTVESPAARALAQGVIVGLANHTVLIAKDGTERPIEDNAAPIRRMDGQVVGCVLVFRDITERQRVEATQRETQADIVSTLESITDAFTRFDRDWRVVYVNAEAERMNQQSRADLLGKTLWDMYPALVGTTLETEYRRAVADQVVVEFEHYFEPWDRWYAIKGYPTVGSGLAIYLRDITASKRADELLRERTAILKAVTEGSPDPIFVKDREGRMLFANAATLRVIGRSENEVLGRNDTEWHDSAEEAATLMLNDRRIMESGEGETVEELVSGPSGSRHYLSSKTPLLDAAGAVVGIIGVTRDITERKRSEDTLRENEQRMRLALEGSATGMWDWDVANDIVQWSPECYVIHGVRVGDFDGTAAAFGQLLHPGDQERVWTTVGAAMATRSPYECEFRIIRPDGEVRWVRNLGRAVHDEHDQPVRMIGTIADMTERKRADEVLRASEERFRALVSATTQIVWTSDASGVVIADSPTWRAFTGQTVEQRIGWGWADAIHPDDLPTITAAWHRVVETTTPLSAEYRLRRHDGEYRLTTVRGVPVMDAAGVVREWIGTNVDVADRRQAEDALRESEERYRMATFAVSDVVWTNNADGLMAGEQPGWSAFTGQSQEEYEGFGWSKAVHPDDAQPTMAAWTEAVAEQRTFIFEHRIHRRDHEWRLCSMRAVPIFRVDGSIREWVGVHTDITEQRQSEEMLRQFAAEMSEADRRKDEFLATLAHELRNPLAPLRNGLEVIKLAGGTDVTIERTRRMMERQLTQMVRLIDDLMDVGRISQGKLELRTERLPLTTILNSAVESTRPLIEQMGHHLIVTSPTQPIMVNADLTRLAQVFVNLLNNAAKYGERGGQIQLHVEVEGGQVVVTVRDTGIGIAADQLPRIFDLFTQVSVSSEKTQGGLGIGLTLVKRLVELHGGVVEARSEGLGKGSQFVVQLPVAIEGAHPHSSADTQARHGTSSLRILIVDDNRDAAESSAMLLRIMGNDTRTAYDGQAGFDEGEAFRPDVILLDIGLPMLKGYEVSRRVRETSWGAHVVLIAVTGLNKDLNRRRSHDAGFDHHMVKPVDPHALLQILAGVQAQTQ